MDNYVVIGIKNNTMSFELYYVNPVTDKRYRYLDELSLSNQLNAILASDESVKEDLMSKFENLTGRPYGTKYDGKYFIDGSENERFGVVNMFNRYVKNNYN